MKKILIASNLILLILLIFQTCRCWKKDPNGNGSATGNPPHTFCEDSTCFGYSGVEPHGMIDFNTAKKMADDYADDAGKKFIWNNDIKTDSTDAVNIWFDLKKVKTFIGLIESALCKAGCVKKDSFGIRIYYAKYPDAATMLASEYLHDVPKEYANHHTIFMVPTYWSEERKEHIDFDPTSTGTNCTFPPFNPSSAKTQYIFAPFIGGTSDAQGQNHGSLKPPPAGGSFPTN